MDRSARFALQVEVARSLGTIRCLAELCLSYPTSVGALAPHFCSAPRTRLAVDTRTDLHAAESQLPQEEDPGVLSFGVQSSVSSAMMRSDIWQISSSWNDVVCTTMRCCGV
jgi:hypothetical protein